jgi:hypothetical protein
MHGTPRTSTPDRGSTAERDLTCVTRANHAQKPSIGRPAAGIHAGTGQVGDRRRTCDERWQGRREQHGEAKR